MPTLQHAGARRRAKHQARPPAAEHFMRAGPLQRFVRRQWRHCEVSLLALIARNVSSMDATTTSNQIVKFIP